MTDLIIFAGQSNMQGQSGALTDTAEVKDAFEYRYLTDTLVPLKNPVGECILVDLTPGYPYAEGMDAEIWRARHVTGSAALECDNMLPSFARAYLAKRPKGTKLAALHIAKGSTVIADWMPGTVGWRIYRRKTAAAIKRIEEKDTLGRIFFVWLQGESDAIYESTKEYYKSAITLLARSLEKELHVEKFGIILVGRFTGDNRDDRIIEAQEEVCREDGGFLMLTRRAEELCRFDEYMNPEAEGHYNPRGIAIIGKAAGEALGEYAGGE